MKKGRDSPKVLSGKKGRYRHQDRDLFFHFFIHSKKKKYLFTFYYILGSVLDTAEDNIFKLLALKNLTLQ